MRRDWHLLQVGAPYLPGRTRYPEAVQYTYRAGGHELLLWLSSPSPREVESIQRGRASFALSIEPPLIVLLYRFAPAITWSDAPFSIHLVPPAQRVLPPPLGQAEESRALLQVILVDADTGIVRALRQLTWSPAFTAAIHAAIAAQATMTWDAQAYDAALRQLYQRYPTSEALLSTATARTEGGA
ncbi:MAG: hypothetical protein KatS3mg060_1145 [Dehalococcoidia bacterium]|nr:MAG: hypothetical protein KatS3mg060_1145 [Dehalococcoidia bacterium]